MKDSLGRELSQYHTPRPRWPEPYSKDFTIAGYRPLKYIGFRRSEKNKKAQHWYQVACLTCGAKYERVEGGLSRAISKGTRGCNACAKKRYAIDKEASIKREYERIQRESRLWQWVNSLMPVTSLRLRDEMGQCFDSENAKVLGWRTI